MLFGVALATLMIPYLVILVTQYVLFYHFGWIDTFLPLIVPRPWRQPVLHLHAATVLADDARGPVRRRSG